MGFRRGLDRINATEMGFLPSSRLLLDKNHRFPAKKIGIRLAGDPPQPQCRKSKRCRSNRDQIQFQSFQDHPLFRRWRKTGDRDSDQVPVQPLYLEAVTLVERLHRRLLDVIKDEFDHRGRADINSVQALLLYNIGDKELTAGELRTRGY